MHCVKCGSDRLMELSAEIAIHFSARENLDKPHVFVFPKVMVCLDCGFSEFSIAEPELRNLGGAIARNESLLSKLCSANLC